MHGHKIQQDCSVNNRRGRRMSLSCRLCFVVEEGFEGEATLLDVSTGGCRASSAVAVHKGMSCTLSLFLPDHHPWPLVIDKAVVRWVDGPEFGVEFTAIRPAQRERLRALLMKAKP